jgi:hypothetical protein
LWDIFLEALILALFLIPADSLQVSLCGSVHALAALLQESYQISLMLLPPIILGLEVRPACGRFFLHLHQVDASLIPLVLTQDGRKFDVVLHLMRKMVEEVTIRNYPPSLGLLFT